LRFVLLLMSALIVGSCATTINQSMPPENYKGPIAAQPVIQQGDSTRVKPTSIISNLHFPLWIGKTWRYESEARRPNQPPTSKASIPAWIECYVDALSDVTVPAGNFRAFHCECQCRLVGGEGFYQEGCGELTIWYVPEVKNVVKMKTQSTAGSFELIGHKVSDRISDERKMEDQKSKIGGAKEPQIPTR
jgi:hypothetical protein